MSRRAFNPTSEQRAHVEAMIGYGIPEAEVCLLIKNPETGKPIDLKTLRKHFAAEIASGAAKVKSLVGNLIVASILGRDGGLQDERARARLAVFFAEARMGWKQTVANRHEHVGRPIDANALRQKISDRIARLARGLESGKSGGSSRGADNAPPLSIGEKRR
jgi:hypothetical protein